jgi:hypothetical protein
MRKMIKVLLTSGCFLMSATSVSMAHDGYYRYHHGHPGHYRHHRREFNPAPFIAGAIGMAIIGGILYDQYGRRCYNRIMYYDVNGNPVVQTVCE